MDIEHQIQRLEALSQQRGELKALAAEAGVPYTTALRLVDSDSRPGAIENLARLVAALDRREGSSDGNAEAA